MGTNSLEVAILFVEPVTCLVSGEWCEFLRDSVDWPESKMAEDVNIQSSGYDEDLCENPFFKYMQTKQKQLYDEVASKRWTVGLTFFYISPRLIVNEIFNILFRRSSPLVFEFPSCFCMFSSIYRRTYLTFTAFKKFKIIVSIYLKSVHGW